MGKHSRRWVVTTSLAAMGLAACAGSAASDGDDELDASNSALVCPESATGVGYFGGLTPSSIPVDYLAWREESAPAGGRGTLTRVAAEQGTRCLTASSRAACSKAVDDAHYFGESGAVCVAPQRGAAPQPGEGPGGCWTAYLLFTRGDEVGTVRTKDDALRLVGRIDTLEKARFFLGHAGYPVQCGSSIASARYRRTSDDGFELTYLDVKCDHETERVRIRLHENGDVEEVSRSGTGERFGPCGTGGPP